MTNQTAIENLKGCIVSEEWKDGKPTGNIMCDLTREILSMAIAALEKQDKDMQDKDAWILADDIPPKFPCLTVDGMGNYPKAWHSIVTITDEHGKKLYFTDDIFHFGMVDKAYKPIICEENAIKWWKPLTRPE